MHEELKTLALNAVDAFLTKWNYVKFPLCAFVQNLGGMCHIGINRIDAYTLERPTVCWGARWPTNILQLRGHTRTFGVCTRAVYRWHFPTLRESMYQFKLVEMFFSPPSGSYYIDQWLWVVFKMFFLSGHWEAFCPMDILLPLSQPSPLRNAGCWKLTTWSHQILWNLELNLHGECLWHVLRALEVHDFKINWKLLAPARCKQFQASAWL